MSQEQQNQRDRQQRQINQLNRQQHPRQQQPLGSRSLADTNYNPELNLYLHYPHSYQQRYEGRAGWVEGTPHYPLQSGFVSSTKWTPGDIKWYKAQTKYAPDQLVEFLPEQDPKVTWGEEEDVKHFTKEHLEDY